MINGIDKMVLMSVLEKHINFLLKYNNFDEKEEF